VDLEALSARLGRALAEVSCRGRSGRAVFVGADRAVAALACAPDELVPLLLVDGRELLGRAAARDAALGITAVEVPGAGVAHVDLGQSLEVAEGETLWALVEGDPGTLEPATARGLSAALGVPVLALDAGGAVLAGPVLDRRGRLAGLVPHEPVDPARPALAAPAESLAALFPGAPPPEGRWEETRGRLDGEDRRAAEAFAEPFRRDTLVGARASGDGTMAFLLARRAGARPAAEELTAEVGAGEDGGACLARGSVTGWLSVEEALERPGRVPLEPALAARLRWARARGTIPDLWLGEGELRLDCELDAVEDGAVLRPEGAGSPGVPVPRAELLAERARAAAERREAEEEAARRVAEEERRRAEAEAEKAWRGAFRQAHDRLQQLGARLQAVDRERSLAEGHAQYAESERLRQEREALSLELREAEEDLQELERQASLAAVPRAWRR
jgi:hypothetical protein